MRKCTLQITTYLIQNSKLLMGCLILVTLILMLPASRVKIDTSGVSFDTADSEEYKDYLAFIDAFGTDDYILLAVKNSLVITDPELKKRIKYNKC